MYHDLPAQLAGARELELRALSRRPDLLAAHDARRARGAVRTRRRRP